MNTFNRYLIHFGIIGSVVFIIFFILIMIDGGKLVNPLFLSVIVLLDLFFVFFMTLFFYAVAKPVSITFTVKDRQALINELSEVASKKWKRNNKVETKETCSFEFGNKYKDWLATPIEFIFEDEKCTAIVPSYYQEDVLRINRKLRD
ncbi:hypothetical protein [Pseudobutyrivibrio ruminis]|jgi:hypothetical protein|uniref:Uncharacterized protein n=1 Tax=Pseudobutyrivibrio ruminis TaxID=46206 RepID=A0A2G3DSE8_9FIRM|nr:hypothetical protein [Pseudobutyrivibrio ruminis]PHU33881.1 hypothetical protein CSX01_12930 [Pseudobutyrivibrio ruminis]